MKKNVLENIFNNDLLENDVNTISNIPKQALSYNENLNLFKP